MLRKWKAVYLGHYHNTHDITAGITHLPSLFQASFGEDSLKGFTIIKEDFSYEIIRGDFKEYIKLDVNLDEVSSADLKSMIQEFKHSQDVIRFEITGAESKLKALDKVPFREAGIDIKIKYESKYKDEKVPKPKLIEKYDSKNIEDAFKSFCKNKNLNYEEGHKFLKEFLKKQGYE